MSERLPILLSVIAGAVFLHFTVHGHGQPPETDAGSGLVKQVQELVPPGTILAYSGPLCDLNGKLDERKVPTGYMICDGREVPVSGRYQRLYDVYGNHYGAAREGFFRLPDYRGHFLRAADWEETPKADVERDHSTLGRRKLNAQSSDWVGSVQPDAMRRHSHIPTWPNPSEERTNGKPFQARIGAAQASQDKDASAWWLNYTAGTGLIQELTLSGPTEPGTRNEFPSGKENRPKNIAVYYLVKF